MPQPPTPLDFEAIGAERQAKIKAIQDKNAQAGTSKYLDANPADTFSTLPVKKPEATDGFTATPPTGINQLGVQAPKEHFGSGALKALGDVREGTVKNVPTLLRPFAFPLVKAGQGVLAGLEWSGNVAETIAPHAVDAVQKALPGTQKMERLVAENKQAGLSHSKAVRKAWEDHHGTYELPFKIPFATTAFTPDGSITLDFQDVIEAGFDPIDLALTFATGGFSKGTGLAAAAVGRQSAAAGLKVGVTESIGARGIRNIASKSAKIPGEVASGGAGTRAAIAGLPSPSDVIHGARESVSDVLHPNKAYEKRQSQIAHAPEPDDLAPGLIAEEEHIEQITTKDWRFDNVLNKIPEMIRGKETTRRYQAISGLGQQTYDRIIKLADPSAVIGENGVAKASVIRENAAARLAQQIGVGLSYVNREVFDKVFNVDQFGRTRVGNMQLTPQGRKFFGKIDKETGKPRFTKEEIAKFEAEGFMMGDILELALSDLLPGGKGTRSGMNSYFTGLTPDQNLAINRFHKYTEDWLKLAEREGAIEVKNGQRVGFKFGLNDADEPTQAFGDVDQMFRYHHREAISGEIWDEAGETKQFMFKDGQGDGFGSGRGDFESSRHFETMEEGAREGILYAHPMEAAESMAITLSQMIADKRAMNYLKRENIVVTNKDAFERLFPNMMQDLSHLRKAEKSAVANMNRLMRKASDRKSKAVHVTGGKSDVKSVAADAGRRGREAFVASNQAQGQLITLVRRQLSYMDAQDAYTAILKKGKAASTQDKIKARTARNQARKYYGQAKRVFNEKVGVSYKANDRAKAAAGRLNTSANRVQKFEEEVLGITNDLELAKKEVALVAATISRIENLKVQRMERIAKSRDMQLKAFGETGEAMKKSRVEVTHFQNGPLAKSFAPQSHAKELKKAFGDNGIDALRNIEKVTGTARTLAAGSADIGWMGIQGSLLAAMHPFTFAKAAVNSLEAVLQPGKRDIYVVDNLPDIMDFLKNGGDLGSSEFFTAIDRTGTLSSVTNWLTVKEGKTPKWIPGGGGKVAPRGSRVAKMTELWGRDVKPLGRLGSGFNTFVDISKVELWKSFNPMLAANVMTKREIATYINNVTGTLNSQMLGVRQTQRQLEGGMLLFSPRFTRSAFAVTGQAMKALTGGAKGAGQIEGLATREAVKSISGMIAASTTLMAGYAMATGQWEEFKENGLNPMKPGWLTVTVGGQRVGVGGSTRALLDTVFKSAASMAELDDNQASDLTKWNIFDPLHRAQNPIPNFWLNRMAPGVRDFMLGETFDGQALDTPSDYVVKGMAPKFAPFAMQEYLNPSIGNPNPSAISTVAESTGLRGRPMSIFEQRAAMRNELAKDAYGRKWEHLDVDERNTIEALDRDNRGRLAEIDELVQTVESPTVGKYFADRKSIDTMIDDTVGRAANALKVHKNGATFREEYDAIMREARNSRIRLEESGIHEDAIKYLDDKRQSRLEGETLFNQIFDEYVDTVKNVDNYEDEATGLVDWDKKDKAETEFLKSLKSEFGNAEGETLYNRMRNNYLGRNAEGERFQSEPDFAGQEVVFALRDAREELNAVRYWQQARDIIGDNDQMLMVWNHFEMSDPLTQEAMKRQYRGLARIQKQVTRRRDRIRKNNPAVDQALIDFYGHRAKNRGNVRNERTQLREMRQDGLTPTPLR